MVATIAPFIIVVEGIPYFPFPNKPLKNGQKHRTTHIVQITSPMPEPLLLDAWGRNPNNIVNVAIRCTSRRAVPGTKIGDSSKVNLPSSALVLSLDVDWSFLVTSNTVSDSPKSLSTTLKTPNDQAHVDVIRCILWLFHHACIDKPMAKYSYKQYRL